MDDAWISAAEALALVDRMNPYSAARSICGRANDGVVAARAHTLIIGDRRAEDVDVPAQFWWAPGHAALEQKWQSGDFETWIDQKFHCRAYGVRFLKRDIVAMLPPERTTGSQLKLASEGNYAPASRCIEELQRQLSCTKKEAAVHIVRFCRAGLVEGRCASFWYEVTDIFGTHEVASDNVAIPSWFWEKCALAPDAILDWQSGTFAGRGMVGAHMHKARIRGAEFDVSGLVDMENMLREQDSPPASPLRTAAAAPSPQSAEPTARGGRPKSENWANWIAELVCYVYEEGIPQGAGAEGQDAMIGAVEERLALRDLESPSRSTVQAAVRAALLRLRSAGN
jgi:hypothetical protein